MSVDGCVPVGWMRKSWRVHINIDHDHDDTQLTLGTEHPCKMTEHRDPSSIGEGTFISTLLAPGSSLNPTFLLILDGSFALLLAVLLLLLWLSSMSLHVAALIAIEVGLWVSVKW